jgi:hypothetical protein
LLPYGLVIVLESTPQTLATGLKLDGITVELHHHPGALTGSQTGQRVG